MEASAPYIPTATLPEIAEIIRTTWTQPDRGHKQPRKTVFCLLGEPGIGKSSQGQQIRASLAPVLGVTPERSVMRNMSDMDVPDWRGLPDTTADATRWKPDEFFAHLREGTGPALLQLDEVSDCNASQQNALCSIVLDGKAGDLHLTDHLYIILTGNLAAHKTGANRLSTKLGDRMSQFAVEFSQPAWEAWAHEHDIDPDIIAFHRWKADTTAPAPPAGEPDRRVSDAFAFDPNRSINPTPRAWERASRFDRSLPPALYLKALASCLTLGPATEFIAFQQYWKDLPTIEAVWANPTELPLPTALQGQYALAMYVASLVQPGVATQFFTLVQRLPNMLRVPTVMAATTRCPGLVGTAAYSQWAIANAHIMF